MKRQLLLASLIAAGFSMPVAAQYAGINDVIAQTIAGMNAPRPNKCFDGRWTPSAKKIANGPARAEAAMANYRQHAAAGGDLRKAIGDYGMRRWQLDGAEGDIRNIHDPIIANISRMERVAVRPGNEGAFYRAQWRALAADGTELGRYDGLMRWNGLKFMTLDLYSPAAIDTPVPDTPFCQTPGDVEKWREAKGKS